MLALITTSPLHWVEETIEIFRTFRDPFLVESTFPSLGIFSTRLSFFLIVFQLLVCQHAFSSGLPKLFSGILRIRMTG